MPKTGMYVIRIAMLSLQALGVFSALRIATVSCLLCSHPPAWIFARFSPFPIVFFLLTMSSQALIDFYFYYNKRKPLNALIPFQFGFLLLRYIFIHLLSHGIMALGVLLFSLSVIFFLLGFVSLLYGISFTYFVVSFIPQESQLLCSFSDPLS